MKKQKVILIIIALFFFIFLSYSQIVKAPKIFCEDATYNFGTSPNTNIIRHKFIIKNIGNDVLKIFNIGTSCNCTIASLKTKEILPGDETEIQAEFHLKGRNGKQRKIIYIESNDPDNKRYKLVIEGVVTE